ncbi:Dihydrolipoyl dehydrogenase [uncultured archaeon]|nr:Dihydrolipoyl dehydrogenase [uncultured archaeon]
MQSYYDLIVLGGSKSGVLASSYAGFLGAKVLLIEKHDFQVSINSGKLSFRTLFGVSRILNLGRKTKNYGFKIDESGLSLSKVYDEVKKVSEKEHQKQVELLKTSNVHVEFGDFHFTDENTGVLEREEGKLELRFKKCIIASGSIPFIPKIKGLDSLSFYTYENIFSLKEVPKELILLGGGPFGILFAQFFARMGSKVKIIQRTDGILPKEEKLVSTTLLPVLKSDGIEVYLNDVPLEFTLNNNLFTAKLTNSSGKNFDITGTHLLVCTGRKPNVENFDLDKAEIKFDLHGVKHNDYLRTTDKRVYVVGDASDTGLYSNVDEEHAFIAVKNALFFIPVLSPRTKVSTLVVPYSISCQPEVSRVGFTEEEVKELELKYKTYVVPIQGGFLKIITNSKQMIIGCTCVGKNSSGLINQISFAISNNIPVTKLIEFVRVDGNNFDAINRISELALKDSFSLSKKNFFKWVFKLKG